MIPPPMSRGIRRVEMRKALVRTRSRYSRFAMSQTLCIDAVSYGFDEDLFEGWFHHFEASDAGTGDGLGKKRLRIGAVAKLDLRHAVVVLVTLYCGMVEEGGIAFEDHLDAVLGVARLDRLHASGEDEVAAVNEADGVAELLHL